MVIGEITIPVDQVVNTINVVIVESLKYNRFNLLHWRKYVEMVLERRKLDSHLKAEITASHATYTNWKVEDAMV